MALVNKKSGEVRYEGRVVRDLGRRERRLMSDVYADVWSCLVVADDGRLVPFDYDSNFECWSDRYSLEVDLAPEWDVYREAAGDYFAAIDALSSLKEKVSKRKRALALAEKAAPSVEPDKGDEVEVTRASKGAPKGARGKVFWVGSCRFSGKPRVGFKGAGDKTYWSNAVSVKVVGAEARAAKLKEAKVEKAAARLEAAEWSLKEVEKALPDLASLYAAARLGAGVPAPRVREVGETVWVHGWDEAVVTEAYADGSVVCGESRWDSRRFGPADVRDEERKKSA
jgi:hypothetical protein